MVYPEKQFSERELERIAGIPHANTNRNIRSLLAHGLVNMQRAGKTNLYSLNKKHVLIPSLEGLFLEERNLIATLKEVIKQHTEEIKEIKLVVLFGSIIKGEERADSDIDIFITYANRDIDLLEDKLRPLSIAIRNKFGNPVSFYIKKKTELRRLVKKAIYSEIRRGELILRRDIKW